MLVWTRVEVNEERVWAFDEDLDGEIVVAPPPTVEMTVKPTPLVVVMTSPAVSDGEEEDVVSAADVIDAVSDDAALSDVGVDAVSEAAVDDSPPSGTGVTRVVGSEDSPAEVVVGRVPLLI